MAIRWTRSDNEASDVTGWRNGTAGWISFEYILDRGLNRFITLYIHINKYNKYNRLLELHIRKDYGKKFFGDIGEEGQFHLNRNILSFSIIKSCVRNLYTNV